MADEAFELYPQTSFVPKKTGRPRMEFSQKYGDLICDLLVSGSSLRSICAQDDMPSIPTVMKWLKEPVFAEQYARARQLQQDTYADEIIHIADTEADANKARVRIDARKWHASKLSPKKYGERLELAGDPENPLFPIGRIELVAPKDK